MKHLQNKVLIVIYHINIILNQKIIKILISKKMEKEYAFVVIQINLEICGMVIINIVVQGVFH